jgi:starvation-inducible DNA-binding protein
MPATTTALVVSASERLTRHDLPAPSRARAVETLNDVLAHTLDLELQARQAHWNVTGPNFVALHEMFGRLVAKLNSASDVIAERVAQLGGIAEGTAGTIQRRSALNGHPRAADAPAYLAMLATATAATAAITRHALNEVDRKDVVSADILTGVLRELEWWLWHLEAHLADGT